MSAARGEGGSSTSSRSGGGAGEDGDGVFLKMALRKLKCFLADQGPCTYIMSRLHCKAVRGCVVSKRSLTQEIAGVARAEQDARNVTKLLKPG